MPQIKSADSPADHLVDCFLSRQTAHRCVEDLAVFDIDVPLMVSLPNEDRSADPSQASNLNDVLQFEMLNFPSKTDYLLLSHTYQTSELPERTKRPNYSQPNSFFGGGFCVLATFSFTFFSGFGSGFFVTFFGLACFSGDEVD